MGEAPWTDGQLVTLLVFLGLVALAAAGVILHARSEWRALRHVLFKPDEEQAGLSRPSRVAERLAPDRWGEVFRATLAEARRDLGAAPAGAAGAALEAVCQAEEALAPRVREVALRAMTGGEPRSTVVRLGAVTVYALVVPGRQEDRRALRRHEALAGGWPAHAAAVRRAAAEGAGTAPPLVALIYYLGLDARDGTLLLAYEGDDGRWFPEELAGVGAPAEAPAGPVRAYGFALA
jgi:hypothetical protein